MTRTKHVTGRHPMRSPDRQRPAQDPARCELLAEVANLYYMCRLDQEEIATRIGVSRSTVSRMLGEASDLGIVEFRIRRPLAIDKDLGRQAVREFALRDALVISAEHIREEQILARLGGLTAKYLDSTLGKSGTLAISWGTALRAVADNLEHEPSRSIDVLQMIGGSGRGDPEVDGTELARRFAGLLGGRCRYLAAPLIVDDPALADALRRQPAIRDVLIDSARADMALVGVGALHSKVSSLLRARYISRDEINAARRVGAVGDVCGHHLDLQGNVIELPLSARVVGIERDALRRLPRVVGVAAGREKVPALVAALRSEILNVVVTDSCTMTAVLELHNQHSWSPKLPTAEYRGLKERGDGRT